MSISRSPTLQPVPRDQELPLSYAQQGIWFVERFLRAPLYVDPLRVYFTGVLDVSALRRAINEIACRHETLRSSFPSVAGRPVQVISPELVFLLPIIDLEPLPSFVRESDLRRLLDEDAKRPFDLSQGPLLRVRLVRLGATEHVLLLAMHHIITDAWSWWAVFLPELASLYKAFVVGLPSPLPPLPIQYADYAYWQRQWLRGKVLEKHLAFWKQLLHNAPPPLELPIKRCQSQVQSPRSVTKRLTLSQPLFEALRTLSRRENATPFMVLLAAFKALLHRYTNETDIVVGTRVAVRSQIELESLIGFFVNVLPIRTTLSASLSFRELLHSVRQTAIESYVYKGLPFEKLIEELRIRRAPSQLPIFNVVFSFQSTPQTMPKIPNLTAYELKYDPETLYHLDFVFYEEGGHLRSQLTYNTSLFDDVSITRLLDHFLNLLAGIVQDPNATLAALPLFDDAAKRQILPELELKATDAKDDHDDESGVPG
jgi:hypothetical protein